MRRHDLVFISYDEDRAEENWRRLLARFPYARRISGIAGIHQAHIRAGGLAATEFVFVVDADNEVDEKFDFVYQHEAGQESMTAVWMARNAVNDLVYGYGGVKLFPRRALLSASTEGLDFTRSTTEHLVVVPSTASTTRFNTSRFSAWRAGFREATKLFMQDDESSKTRLHVWKTVGDDREFGIDAMQGAHDGEAFAKSTTSAGLRFINDYAWLKRRFDAR